MEYLNLTKKEMMELVRELMEEQRLDPQDFMEISLNYATDEEIMAYTQQRYYEGDFEDFEIDNGSTRRKALIDSLYDGSYDYEIIDIGMGKGRNLLKYDLDKIKEK